MKSKGKSQPVGSGPMATEDAVSSDEWFTRYLLDAVFLAVLMLTAIGVALYLDGGAYLRDGNREPGAGFLTCMVLCPALGVVTLGLAFYAGVRLFLRPHTWGHAFIRLTLLVAHLSVFLVCADTISSTATALVGSVGPSSAGTDPTEVWRTVEGRASSGSPGDEPGGAPDGSSFSPPSGMGMPRLGIPGR